MRVQSIGTAIEHDTQLAIGFLGSAVEMTIGKKWTVSLNRITSRKVGAMLKHFKMPGIWLPA